MKRRVVKVGGSLLEIKNVGPQLSSWLSENDDMQNIIVVGGGCVADVIRKLQKTQSMNNDEAHELACRSLRLTATLVAYSCKEALFIDHFGQLEKELKDAKPASNIIFDSSEWILNEPDVPESWHFTSDSIAARLASNLSADELVLIKSRQGELDEPGFVDAFFATESSTINNIRVCTLDE